MPNRRDLLLQEMGIDQWELTRPEAMHGFALIKINEKVKLIIVSDDQYHKSKFSIDVSCAFGYSTENVHWLNSNQLSRIELPHSVDYCLFTDTLEERESISTHCKKARNIVLTKSELTLNKNIAGKRSLWLDIQTLSHSSLNIIKDNK